MSYFKKKGDSYIIFTATGLILSLAMVVLIMTIILVKGLGFFWPSDLVQVKLQDGKAYLGEQWAESTKHEFDTDGNRITHEEIQFKIGNRDLYGLDFIWLSRNEIEKMEKPKNAFSFERLGYGNFYGFIKSLNIGDKQFNYLDEQSNNAVEAAHDKAVKNRHEIKELENDINKLNTPLVNLQREISLLQLKENKTPEEQNELEKLQKEEQAVTDKINPEYQKLSKKLESIYLENQNIFLNLLTADNREKKLLLADVVRIYRPNDFNVLEKSWIYVKKFYEFVADEPRESNTEGGVFPAIFGTVMMVLLMSIAVVPFGILAAIYLNEYAKQGAIIRMIRLSVNNLAGVPSIVYGIFGLGFFVYALGGTIDQLFFSSTLPEPTFGTGGILWASLTLALLTLPVVIVATEEGILAVPRANKEGALALGSTRWQMVRKIVLPNAMPGILTGLILAISRGAGEVAPLMITGVVKLAPSLPLDASFPFLHLDRKFMHLGFHIYDVGFQSPNVEAAKPMVYTTALLLIVIVVLLNILAIYIRNRLRKKYKTSVF
ncbi:MAG TPA: phosphate ABC transporter permease PstA [Caldithrix sp.]|nr:phosphate ABC transporter permease PstA [Caldithrix sp.]